MRITFTLICLMLSAAVLAQRYEFQGNKLVLDDKIIYTKPLLLFNQDRYTPGDSVFFKLFILTEDTTRLQEHTIFNLDLLDDLNQLVQRELIVAGRSGSYNQLVLPKYIPAGNYKLVVYSGKPQATNASVFPIVVTGNTEKQRELIGLYPEGGKIISQRLTRVLVKSLALSGTKVAISDGKQQVVSTTINADGWGSFLFVPYPGKSYQVVTSKNQSFALPPSENNGSNIRLFQLKKGFKVIEVNSTLQEPLTLLLLNQRKIVYQKILDFKRGQSQIMVEDSFFPDGYSHLIVVNQQQDILTQRPVYVEPKRSIQVDFNCPEITGQRQLVQCTVKVGDTNTFQSVLSVSVFHKSGYNSSKTIADPSIVLAPFDIPANSVNAESIENEFIAQSHLLFQQHEPKPDRNSVPRTALTLRGRLVAESGPLRDTTIVYFCFQKSFDRYQVKVNLDGTLELSLNYDLYEDDFIYYRVEQNGKEKKKTRIIWEDNGDEITSRLLDDKPKSLMAKVTDSYKYFLDRSLQVSSNINPNQNLERKLQDPDITVNPDEFTAFETMEDLFREIVPSLLFRKSSNDSIFRVFLENQFLNQTKRFSNGDPLFIVDGWMTDNTNEIMKLSATSIATVKIINDTHKLDQIGRIARNGIVFIQTKTPEQSFKKFGQRLLKVKGFSSPKMHLYVPPLLVRQPSFETNLFWRPVATTSGGNPFNFSFFTSDMIGDFIIRVVGIASTGELVFAEKPIRVEFRSSKN